MSMRSTADRMRATADELRNVAALVGTRVKTMTFAGPAADRFRATQSERVATLSAAAERMDALSARLLVEAAQVELDRAEQMRLGLGGQG
jgi:hypothetical protein